MNSKKIAILGCGWLGEKIANYFYQNQYKIFTFNSSLLQKEKLEQLGYHSFQKNFYDKNNDLIGFFKDFQAVIIAIPMKKNVELEKLKIIYQNISSLLKNTNATIFLCSSTGIYPQKTGIFNENSFQNDELDVKILTLEQLIYSQNSNTNILRLAGLMGDDRIFSHNFKEQNSLEAVNHIHFQDIILILEKMIVKNLKSKIYNVVAPIHPSKKAIFSYQKHKILIEDNISESRIILSDCLIKDLEHQFLHPNPIYF